MQLNRDYNLSDLPRGYHASADENFAEFPGEDIDFDAQKIPSDLERVTDLVTKGATPENLEQALSGIPQLDEKEMRDLAVLEEAMQEVGEENAGLLFDVLFDKERELKEQITQKIEVETKPRINRILTAFAESRNIDLKNNEKISDGLTPEEVGELSRSIQDEEIILQQEIVDTVAEAMGTLAHFSLISQLGKESPAKDSLTKLVEAIKRNIVDAATQEIMDKVEEVLSERF